MKPYRGFADLIRLRRKNLGLTLSDVAEKTDWSVPYVSELERGVKQPPPPENLERLAEALRWDAAQTAAMKEEAELSRRSVEIELEGTRGPQRQLAVMLARRLHVLSDEDADELLKAILEKSGGADDSAV